MGYDWRRRPFLVLMSAGASALITRNQLSNQDPAASSVITKEETVIKTPTHKHASREEIRWNDSKPVPAPVRQAQAAPPPCDDRNIVGTVLGGLGGGLVGSQVGKGNGQVAATAVGVAAGAVAGNEYIPTRNVTCQ